MPPKKSSVTKKKSKTFQGSTFSPSIRAGEYNVSIMRRFLDKLIAAVPNIKEMPEYQQLFQEYADYTKKDAKGVSQSMLDAKRAYLERTGKEAKNVNLLPEYRESENYYPYEILKKALAQGLVTPEQLTISSGEREIEIRVKGKTYRREDIKAEIAKHGDDKKGLLNWLKAQNPSSFKRSGILEVAGALGVQKTLLRDRKLLKNRVLATTDVKVADMSPEQKKEKEDQDIADINEIYELAVQADVEQAQHQMTVFLRQVATSVKNFNPKSAGSLKQLAKLHLSELKTLAKLMNVTAATKPKIITQIANKFGVVINEEDLKSQKVKEEAEAEFNEFIISLAFLNAKSTRDAIRMVADKYSADDLDYIKVSSLKILIENLLRRSDLVGPQNKELELQLRASLKGGTAGKAAMIAVFHGETMSSHQTVTQRNDKILQSVGDCMDHQYEDADVLALATRYKVPYTADSSRYEVCVELVARSLAAISASFVRDVTTNKLEAWKNMEGDQLALDITDYAKRNEILPSVAAAGQIKTVSELLSRWALEFHLKQRVLSFAPELELLYQDLLDANTADDMRQLFAMENLSARQRARAMMGLETVFATALGDTEIESDAQLIDLIVGILDALKNNQYTEQQFLENKPMFVASKLPAMRGNQSASWQSADFLKQKSDKKRLSPNVKARLSPSKPILSSSTVPFTPSIRVRPQEQNLLRNVPQNLVVSPEQQEFPAMQPAEKLADDIADAFRAIREEERAEEEGAPEL